MLDFVDEFSHIQCTGIQYKGQVYAVSISIFVCDTPARAYVKQVKSHSGYYGCDKCRCHGEYSGKVIFPELDAPLRSDESFRNRLDEDHHIGPNPLARLSLGMVTRFPLDYMHLVCLGVTRRLLVYWIKGPLKKSPWPPSKIADFRIFSCIATICFTRFCKETTLHLRNGQVEGKRISAFFIIHWTSCVKGKIAQGNI